MMRALRTVATVVLIALLGQLPHAFWWDRRPSSVVVIERALQQSGFSESEIAEAVAKHLQTLPLRERVMPYATVAVWSLIGVASVALLLSKHWGFSLFYSAAAANMFTALSFVPGVSWLTGWILIPWGWIFIQLCNLAVLHRVIRCHIEQNRSLHNRLTHALGTKTHEIQS